MASVFISYATPDRSFALQLSASIERLGHTVWIDMMNIGVGDSMVRQIGMGLTSAEFLIGILSQHSVQSAWVNYEWEVKYTEEIIQQRTIILPALIADCSIPTLFRHKCLADFRQGYEIGFAQLATALQTRSFAAQNSSNISTMPAGRTSAAICVQQDKNGLAWYSESMVGFPTKFSEVSVELALPYIGKISGLWKPDADEQFAAWELYIELVTRVPVAELHNEDGSLREALTSLYSIFTITRDILHKYGPAIARPKQGGEMSFGFLAISVLNNAIRPLLAHWHTLLLEYEHTRLAAISVAEHERNWNQAATLRQDLRETRGILVNYAKLLAQVAGIPSLYPPQ